MGKINPEDFHNQLWQNFTNYGLDNAVLSGSIIYDLVAITEKATESVFTSNTSMLALLEKALPLIENEAERREQAQADALVDGPYYTEMRTLADAIEDEIAKARGKQINQPEKGGGSDGL